MDSFKKIIKEHLDRRAQSDELFAVTYAKEGKSIDDCCAYIKNRAKQVQQGGCAIISDEEVFNWAVHYYNEDNIKVEKTPNMRVKVNNSSKQTEVKKEKVKQNKKEDINQLSLF